MTVWFTSDLHIGHAFIASRRNDAFLGITASTMDSKLRVSEVKTQWHDEMLAINWDAVVKDDDVVWVLGDISAGGTNAQIKALEWIKARPGRKHLIAGNYDGAHPMHKDSHKWQDRYLHLDSIEGMNSVGSFDSVQALATRNIPLPDGSTQKVMLSHFPYSGDTEGRDIERFEQYRLRDKGLPLLHGHTHTNEKVSVSTHLEPWIDPIDGEVLSHYAPAKQIHVGVDAWDFKPVSLEQIGELLV